MTLHVSPDIKRFTHVRRRIKQRLVEWKERKFQMLALSTVTCEEA